MTGVADFLFASLSDKEAKNMNSFVGGQEGVVSAAQLLCCPNHTPDATLQELGV